MVERKAFLLKPKHKIIYPNEQIEFMVPNPEKKEDCCMDISLAKLTNEI